MDKDYQYFIALDCSLTCTGVAVFRGKIVDADVRDDYSNMELFKVMSIETKNAEDSSRSGKLVYIAKQFDDFKKEYNPIGIAYEGSFSRYIKSTAALYQVQGIMLLAFFGIPMFEYAPSSVKKTIAGKGNSKKDIVQNKIMEIYPKMEFNNLDETDAVAVGIHHIESNKGGS